MSAVAMAAAPQTTVEVPVYYKLNFNRFNAFLDQIKEKEDPIGVLFRHLVAQPYAEKQIREKERTVLENSMMPPEFLASFWPLARLVESSEHTMQRIQSLLNEFNGISPYEVQNLVNNILGIREDQTHRDPAAVKDPDSDVVDPLEGHPNPEAIRQDYFNRMVASGFMQTPYPSLDRLHYTPKKITEDFLQAHLDCDTLIIGCGALAEIGLCYWSKKNSPEEHKNALTINTSAYFNPDVITNMHNAEFWKAIPNGHFEKILDHAGAYIFDGPFALGTLQQIAQKLTARGYYELCGCFDDKKIDMLRQAGFTRFEKDLDPTNLSCRAYKV